MLNTLLQNTFAFLLKFKNNFTGKNPTIDIFRHLAQTQRVLIFMPVKIEQFGVALNSLETLREKQPQWHITVITKLEMVSFVDNRLDVDILPYSNDDLNFLGLPKKQLKSHFASMSYDLALDLKFNIDLLCITLFQLSKAPLKVCFFSANKNPFYNFTIRINPLESLLNKYFTMIKYISIATNRETLENIG